VAIILNNKETKIHHIVDAFYPDWGFDISNWFKFKT
jgi:hypothetical protein